MSNGDNALYEFGDFRLEAASGTLWRQGELVPLSPKAAEVLKLLLEREGGIVSKQEIFDRVWADTFVEDGVLTQNVYTLRNALGLDPNGRQFIETVPRRGYRFAGQIEKFQPEVSPTGESVASIDRETPAASVPEQNDPHGINQRGIAATSPITPGRPGSGITVAIVLGLLVLGASAYGIYQYAYRNAETGSQNFAPIEQLKFQKVTDSGDVVYPTISPDGSLLAYVRLEDEQASVWVKHLPDGEPMKTLPPSRKGYRSLAFSPDGRQLYFREEAEPGAIYQSPVLGGTPKRIAENVWSDFSLSPDGKLLSFIRRDEGLTQHHLILSNTDGSGERVLAVKNSPMDFRGGSPGWAPDGSKLTVASGQRQQYFPKLLVFDIATGAETEISIPRWRSIYRTLWLPDGKRLIVTARDGGERYSQMWMLSVDDGAVRRLTNDLESYFWLSMSADGRLLVTRQQRIVSHLWLLPDADLSRAHQLTSGERALDAYVGLAWTPNGRIIYSSSANNVTDLYSIEPTGGGRIQLTVNAGPDNTDPVVSSAGSVVFTSNRTGSPQIWKMDTEGRSQQQLTRDEQRIRAVSGSFSPDGREVYFIRIGAGPSAIWKVPVEGGEPVKVSNLTDATAESFVAVSPDGKLLAYRHLSNRQESESDERTTQIGVISSDGSGEPMVFDLSMRKPMVQWAPDSKGFYYAAGTFNASALIFQPVHGGQQRKVLDLPDRLFNFAFSADGKDLAVSRGRLLGDAILISNLP